MWGSESSRSNLYLRTKSKIVVFENGQFGGHFVWPDNFTKNVKCYGKNFKNVFDTQKTIFFSGHFFWKKFQKKF